MITFAFGDIHGMADKLEALLGIAAAWRRAYHPSEPFRFVFLGDYGDRGPDAKSVLERVRALQQDGAICLRGNHEALMIASVASDAGMLDFIRNGGDTTLRSLQTAGAFLEATARMRTLPTLFEDDLRLFVHAGIRPNIPLEEQSEQDLLWIRKVITQALARVGFC